MTIGEKIQIAQDLFSTWGDHLRREVKIRSLLEALHEKATFSRKVSGEVGLFATCKHCEEEEGGSCCGAGIENRYSPHLLLINLLLGKTLPIERRFADSCHFLGTEGCMLSARDILCINYLCPGLQKSLAHADLIRLQTATGEEMDIVFLLEEAAKQFLRGRSHDR